MESLGEWFSSGIVIARMLTSREVVDVDTGVCKERGTGHLYLKQAAQENETGSCKKQEGAQD